MAVEDLPELLIPNGICFLASSGNAITPGSLYDDVQPMQGENRKRRVQTYAPRIASVEAVLEAEDAYALDEWFENVLIVGSEKFTARVAELGPSSKYWAAEWVDPPNWTAMHLGRWRVSGQLLLTGEGSDTAPETVTLSFEFGLSLTASASILAPVELAFEFSLPLAAHNPFAFEVALDLEYIQPHYFDRELNSDGEINSDGLPEDRLLREDGTYFEREP